jgi:hypothetical protein
LRSRRRKIYSSSFSEVSRMDFIVNGQRYSLTKQEVEARLRGVSPGPIFRYAVEVNGVLYPVKQVFAIVTGVDQFTSQRARDVLRRLGFSEKRHASGPGGMQPPGPSAVTESASSSAWVLEIRTLGGGSHEFELDDSEDVQALQAEISHEIGSDGSYQGRARCQDAVDGVSEFTIAWRNVAAAVLYQRRGRPVA